MKTTKKKTKVIGQESYVNSNTGEILDMQVIEVEDRDFNFHKLWLGHIVQALDVVGNKKIKVITHILEEMTRDNLYIGTQRQIAERVGVSVKTVNTALMSLISANFLRAENQGVYRINPDVVFKGGMKNRLNILYKYKNIQNEPIPDEDKKNLLDEPLEGQIDLEEVISD